MMFSPIETLIETFVNQLHDQFRRNYGQSKQDFENILSWVGSMALENIANSDALYHDMEHTILVTQVGQEILRCKHIREGGVTREDWFHFTISLICHDIGYIRGVCRADSGQILATGKGDEVVELDPWASDAALTPYHVDRGKLFVTERFGNHDLIKCDIIQKNIELTRFPVPAKEDHKQTMHYPGLVRASDLIGQLSDPRYLQKINRLFYEFEETGVNEALGYKTPLDLRNNYAKFFWNTVFPYVEGPLKYLSTTQQGKQIQANLYANVFVVEHENHQKAFG